MPHIALRGAANVRDLGGIVTLSGRKLLPGRVLRADSLSKLTDSDLEVLAGLGLRTAIDFRSPSEVTHLGPDRLPPQAEGVALPVDAGDVVAFTSVFGDIGKQRELFGSGKAAEFMKVANREFVANDVHREQFGSALRVIADGARQPVLFHCTAGKDRTGWMSAILLTALGVPRDVVMDDYLATNDYIWPAFESQLRPLAEAGQLDMDVLTPLLRQDPSYLDAAFDEVAARYGSFDEFLGRGLSFSADDAQRLRSTLTG